MSEVTDGSVTTDDDELPASITHARDTIVFDGKVEQDYRFLRYLFRSKTGEIAARVYFDDPWTVSIITPSPAGTAIDPDILAYLQKRFDVIQQLGGPEGYTELWVKAKPGV